MHVHAVTVIPDQWLRHEGRGFSVSVGNIVHSVLHDLHFIRLANQGVEFSAYFALPGGCHFVVMNLGFYTQFLYREAHRRTYVVQ